MMDRCLQTLCSLVLLSSLACSTAHMVQLARRNGALRQLMQTVPALLADDAPLVGITVVETALQFSAAVAAGAEHIEVQGHMDLTSLEPSGDTVLGTLPSTVKSIRGNCNTAVPALGLTGAAMLPLRAQQCVLIVDRRMMDTSSDNDLLWVDGLYLRYQRSPEVQKYNAGLIDGAASQSGKMFLTSVTMQGDGDGEKDCGACAVRVGGSMHAEDCTFSDFEGDVMVYTGSGDSAVFEGCKFLDNTAEIAVLTGRSGSIENSGLVRIVASSFERNAAPSVLQARSWEAGEAPVFFSDAPLTLLSEGGSGGEPQSTSSSLEDFPITRVSLSADDEDFTALKQALPSISRTVAAPVLAPATTTPATITYGTEAPGFRGFPNANDPSDFQIPTESVSTENGAPVNGSDRELPKGLLMVIGGGLLAMLLLAGIVALSVSLMRSFRDKEGHAAWDEYMARKNESFVLNVAVPRHNTYIPPEISEDLEAAPQANVLPPRPPSFYAASLGDAYISPIKPSSTSTGRFLSSHLESPEPNHLGRTDSGQESVNASSSSGHSATGQKLLQ